MFLGHYKNNDMGELVIKEVLTKKDRREFIYLPEKVHKNEPDWLPPIYMDEWELYDKKKNKSFKYADALLLLAYRDNKACRKDNGNYKQQVQLY